MVSQAVQTGVREKLLEDSKRRDLIVWLYQEKVCSCVLEVNDELQDESREASASKTLVFRLIERVVKQLSPESQVFLYGSEAAQISLKESDLDISVSPDILRMFDSQLELSTAEQHQCRYALRRALAGILEELQATKLIVESERILWATIPIVKLVVDSRPLGGKLLVKVDLTVELFGGCNSTAFIQQTIKSMPPLQTLVLIVKTILAKKKLNVPFSGGLSSFAVVLLVAAYLVQTGMASSTAYHTLLAGLAEFYGAFEEDKYMVSLQQLPCYLLKGSSGGGLTIIDPMTAKEMKTRCINFDQIKELFQRLFEVFRGVEEQITEWCTALTPKTLEDWRKEGRNVCEMYQPKCNPLREFISSLEEG